MLVSASPAFKFSILICGDLQCVWRARWANTFRWPPSSPYPLPTSPSAHQSRQLPPNLVTRGDNFIVIILIFYRHLTVVLQIISQIEVMRSCVQLCIFLRSSKNYILYIKITLSDIWGCCTEVKGRNEEDSRETNVNLHDCWANVWHVFFLFLH